MNRSKLLLLVLLSTLSTISTAKEKKFEYDFYGFIRGDFFVNSRAAVAPINGMFYLYPLDEQLDADGNDLNAVPNSSFFALVSRVGVDIKGPMIGNAKTSAKVETDFAGFSSSYTMLRLRQAYVKLDWQHNSLLIGQTWHPMFGSVFPDMNALTVGSPFQPFSRTAQFAYTYHRSGWELKAAALWQLQYLSNGPNGKSMEYQNNGIIPEFFFGVEYASGGWRAGAGVDIISIKPRTKSVVGTAAAPLTYKVNERLTAFTPEVHLQYKTDKFKFAAKSLLNSASDHLTMIGGYGVSEIDPRTGEQKYTTYKHSTSWISLSYGTKWKTSIFAGYSKNLGTRQALADTKLVYGTGLDLDQLATANLCFSYNLPHWTLGIEYVPSVAWYGEGKNQYGKYTSNHAISNHRATVLVAYYF